jgi:site-specific recombinase XerD
MAFDYWWVPVLDVQEFMGHSAVQTTETYAHLAPKRQQALVGRLDF